VLVRLGADRCTTPILADDDWVAESEAPELATQKEQTDSHHRTGWKDKARAACLTQTCPTGPHTPSHRGARCTYERSSDTAVSDQSRLHSVVIVAVSNRQLL